MSIGEIKVCASGRKFDQNLPVKGTLIFVMPNGSELSFDVIDIIDIDWYDDIA